LEQEVTHLEHQLNGYKKDFKAMDQDPCQGFVAAKDNIRPDLQNVLSQSQHLQKRQQEIAKISDIKERARQSELLEQELIRESMRQNASQFRATHLGKPFPKGNVALTEIYLSDGTSFGTGSTSRVSGLAPKPLPKSQGGQFEPTIDSHTKRVMDTDSEYKVLSETSEQLGQPNSKANGKAYLYTERKPCESCDGIIQQFKEKHPNIDLDVFWDHPYP
jgi:The  BURPS668_1122 family of deaminases